MKCQRDVTCLKCSLDALFNADDYANQLVLLQPVAMILFIRSITHYARLWMYLHAENLLRVGPQLRFESFDDA